MIRATVAVPERADEGLVKDGSDMKRHWLDKGTFWSYNLGLRSGRGWRCAFLATQALIMVRLHISNLKWRG